MNRCIAKVLPIVSSTLILLILLLQLTKAEAGLLSDYSSTTAGGNLSPVTFTTTNWSSDVHFAVYAYSSGDPIAGEWGYQDFAPLPISVFPLIDPGDETNSILVNGGEYLYVYQIDHDPAAQALITEFLEGILVPALNTITSVGFTNDTNVDIFGLGSGDSDDGPLSAVLTAGGQAAQYTFAPNHVEAGDESFTLFYTSTAPPRFNSATLYEAGNSDTQLLPSPDNDFDNDGVYDDGDFSGYTGDTPCTGGNTTDCDDNCIDTPNPNQEDIDNDGVGDVCDLCPDNSDPDCIFLSDDFNDGNDDGWTQGDGTWIVEGGEYSADGGLFDVAISTVDYSKTTDKTVIEADYFSQPHGKYHNGFIIFDYQGPDDFKYAGAKDGANKWVIGYYDGSLNDLASFSETIDTQRWYRMKVVIVGNTTSLYVDDDRDGSGYIQMAQYTFTDVSSGMIGLAAVSSHSHFDNFDLYTPYPYNDNFNDGNDDGWTQGDGTWTVEGGEYSADGGVSDVAISTVDYSITTDNIVIEADYFSQPDGYVHNGFIIFDYQGPDDFKYAGAKDGANKWVIGYYDGSLNDLVQFSDSIDTSRWYRMKADIKGTTVKLYVDDDRDGSGYVYKTEAAFGSIRTGMTGLAAYLSHAHFDNFAVFDAWSMVSGTWQWENGELSGEDVNGSVAVALLENAQTNNSVTIEADYFSQPDGAYHNGFILFDYQGPDDFKYAGAKDGANKWVIGYYDGSLNDLASFTETIDTQRWYAMSVQISSDTVTLYVDDDRDGSGYVYKTEAAFGSIGTGMTGLAAYWSHAHFDNFDMY